MFRGLNFRPTVGALAQGRPNGGEEFFRFDVGATRRSEEPTAGANPPHTFGGQSRVRLNGVGSVALSFCQRWRIEDDQVKGAGHGFTKPGKYIDLQSLSFA
jgi:hypothetical protein